MSADDLIALETVCKALADSTRLRILNLLRAGEVCVCDIHESLKLPQPRVSRHLAYLRQSGLVHARKDGLWVHYSLATHHDAAIQQVVQSAIHAVTHLQLADRDLKRLAGRSGTVLQVQEAHGAFACCGRARPSP